MNAVIFGANGQDGHYLTEFCQSKNIETIGISHSGDCIHANVAQYKNVEKLIKEYKPTYIFHLAATSTTNHDALFENHQTISTGTFNILESVKIHSPSSKVFVTGSGVQFLNNGEPISENCPFEGNSPYSVSRIQSVYAARYYRSLGMKVYVGYLFHHESPLRKSNHISQIIVHLAQQAAKENNKTITLGDISVQKEWTFAGDIVKGIFALVEQDNIFEAIIGSGKTHSIQDWLDTCFKIIGKPWHNHVKLKENYTSEYKKLVSNPKLIHSLGWKPTVNLSQLARMMVEYKKS
ncbi:MAG: GDP-mannose 4,6-dehydratase [Candidatus Omnitrophica bacterium]|nr:GDP-mannose 4,6-dehydratase [Candidatus Omnitrophota bacterium]